MRVGLAAHLLGYPRAARGGVGRYTRCLIDAMARNPNGHELVVFAGRNGWDGFPDRSSLLVTRRSSFLTSSLAKRLVWENLLLPLASRAEKIDLFHFTDYGMPFICPVPRAVITIHDLSFIRFPETLGRARSAYKRALSRAAVRRARRIVVDCEAMKGELTRLMGVNPERVAVAGAGVSSNFRPVEDMATLEAVRAKYELPDRFVLYVGTIEPRKNLGTLARAMDVLRSTHHLDVPLIIVGPLGWLEGQTFQSLSASSAQIRAIGFVGEQHLVAVYTLASVLAYPSLYEGFGLPAAEAMACGTPVVASDVEALAETVGDAGLLVDPSDPAKIAEALAAVLTQPELRTDLKMRGMERTKGFTWERTADNIWRTLYEAVC